MERDRNGLFLVLTMTFLFFTGPWTLFAPSNEGIEVVIASGGMELSMKDLRHLAAYHIVPGLYSRQEFQRSRLPTLYAGYSIYMEEKEEDVVRNFGVFGDFLEVLFLVLHQLISTLRIDSTLFFTGGLTFKN